MSAIPSAPDRTPLAVVRRAVCLMVPQGSHRPEPLAAAVLHLHPEVAVGAVWCGDPQLRPNLDDLDWWDIAIAVDEHSLVAQKPHIAEWRRAIVVASALLTGDLEDSAGQTFEVDEVALLWVGSVAVLGRFDGLFIAEGDRSTAATFVPRLLGVIEPDGRSPDPRDLLEVGAFSTTVIVLRRDSVPVLHRWGSTLAACPDPNIGELLDRAEVDGGIAGPVISVCCDPGIGAGPWRWPDGDVALLDVPGFDVDRPWVLDPCLPGVARIEIADDPSRRTLVERAVVQLGGSRSMLTLPGGIEVDTAMRAVARHHPELRPWSDPPGARAVLGADYWKQLHQVRRDLQIAFADPAGHDRRAFANWRRHAFVDDDISLLIPPDAARPDQITAAEARTGDGVNVVGYLTKASSLGDVARRLVTELAEAHVAVALLDHGRTESRQVADAPRCDQVARFSTTIAVVNADQFDGLIADAPFLSGAQSRLIAYWFWEVDRISDEMRRALDHVDEIWVGSRFVREVFAVTTSLPVRLLPLPVPAPAASSIDPMQLPPLVDCGERPVFLVVLDHLSVTERKNPVGAIDAFRRAFRENEGPVLVVKTMNARLRTVEHERVICAASGRTDIRVWDHDLPRDDLMALVRFADCLVSLHRSEGLGLHLAEAMWLGTPTIATRWSGNLDFMDDDVSLLVDAQLVPVRRGEGVYPPGASWADPDLDVAASAMRRVVDEPDAMTAMAARARTRMASLADDTSRGERLRRLLGLDR